MTIDARTLDAVALALRFKCPIYTTEDILSQSGILIDLEQEKGSGEVKGEKKTRRTPRDPSLKYKDMDMEELESLLEEAVKEEEYEKASAIGDEINRRRQQ